LSFPNQDSMNACDQQYDSTVIELSRGESYVATAAEAEALGFRRAWRWQGQS
jgi:hypothetical protein